jgi:hypothetical protein
MTRRTGVTAGREAGSTTGVATAVLALLSAGTLATLGVVTAGDLRDLGRGPVPDSQVDAVGPPTPIAVTSPVPTAPPSPGGGSGGAGGGPGTGGVQAGPELVTGGSTGTDRPGLSGAGSGSPAPTPPGATPTPGTPTPTPGPATGPVFTAVTPAPTPSASVLAEKAGRHLGRADKPVKPAKVKPAKVEPATVTASGTAARTHPSSTPRGRAVGHGHGGGKLAVAPVGPLAAPISAAAEERSRHGRVAGRGHGHGHGAAEVPVPFSPVTTTPAPQASAAVIEHDNGHGKAVGRSGS